MPVVTVRNPGTGELLGELPAHDAGQVAAIIEAAQDGQRAMAALPAHERADLLRRVADRIEAEQEALAGLLAAENGKPIQQTRGEVEAAVRIFRGYAGEATRLFGRQIPLDAVPGLERHLAVTIREPLGVVAALVPFNYPVELYAHKAAAALAAGNAVVVQPPARCPLAVQRVAQLVEEAGAPANAHQLVIGGADVSQQLAGAAGIAAVTLTGSTEAGREIARRAAATSPAAAICCGVSASTKSSRTARRWGTVACRNDSAPAGLSTTSAPRLSAAHSSRRIRPRRSIRPRWWERRLRSQPMVAARSEERICCSGASLRASMTT